MKAVRQLDQNDADILGHRQEHFAQVLRLHLLLLLRPVARILHMMGKFQLGQLSDTVDQQCDVFAEFFLDLFNGINRVLHDVVEQARRDGLLVHLQVGQNNGDA